MKKRFLLTLAMLPFFWGLQAMDQDNQKTSSHAVIEIGAENFEKFSGSGKPFIIDTWAEWCGPCKTMKPIFEEVARNNKDYIFGSFDVEKEKKLAKELKVRVLPTFLIIKGNKEYGRIKGAVVDCAEDLLKKFNECLSNEDPVEIGSNEPSVEPREFMMKLGLLVQKPSETDQVKGLSELFKEGLTPDMVLMEVPAMCGRPASKFTAISMILGTNKSFFQVLLDQGVGVDQVNAEIDLQIDEYKKRLEKMDEFKKMLQEHASKK